MTIKTKTKSHPDVVDYFKKLPCYNKYIKNQKPKLKRLKTIDLLFQLSFHEQLNVIKQIMRFKDMQ